MQCNGYARLLGRSMDRVCQAGPQMLPAFRSSVVLQRDLFPSERISQKPVSTYGPNPVL